MNIGWLSEWQSAEGEREWKAEKEKVEKPKKLVYADNEIFHNLWHRIRLAAGDP